MGDVPKRKQLKIGIRKGGGQPPGYEWGVKFFDELLHETRCLSPVQLEHIVEQVRELARQKDPSHPQTIDVRAIEKFHELRDKGGVLGRINFRVYFYLEKSSRTIVILGADKKEEDGQTSQAIKIRMRYRHRRYLNEFAKTSEE